MITPDQPAYADPQTVHAEVDAVLAGLHVAPAEPAAAIGHRARVLEQAHDVLVRALATVDKI